MSVPRALHLGSRRYLSASLMVALLACNPDPGYGGRSSRDWIQSLSDTSATVRTNAADALGKILEIQPQSPKVVQALIEALGDTVDNVRMAAATALVAEGVRAEGAVPGVHAALHDSAHAGFRSLAALILGSLGSSAAEGAIPALTEALDDPHPEVRSTAAEALGKFGEAAAASLPSLRARLSDSSASVRLKALEALFNVRAPDTMAVPAFQNALSDSVASVRAAAAYMLGGLRGRAAPALQSVMAALGDREAEVRAAALFALTEIGPAARDALPSIRPLLDDPDARVRRYAREASAQIDQARQSGAIRSRRDP